MDLEDMNIGRWNKSSYMSSRRIDFILCNIFSACHRNRMDRSIAFFEILPWVYSIFYQSSSIDLRVDKHHKEQYNLLFNCKRS